MDASYVIGQSDFITTTNLGDQSQFSGYPNGISYDPGNDYLFVGDKTGDRILVFDLSGGITNGMNASFVLGQTDYVTYTSGTSISKLNGPTSLNYDIATDFLYITDSGNNRVLVFDLSLGITNGMDASYVIGQSDFDSGGSNLTQNGLYTPVDSEISSGKYLYTGERGAGGRRILVFDIESHTNGPNAIMVLGQPNFTSNYTNLSYPNKYGFSSPQGVEVDLVNKKLFVADYSNNRVLIFNLDSSGDLVNYEADNVLGQPDFSTVTSGTTQSKLKNPVKLEYDSSTDKLFVADVGNNRVMVFDLSLGITDGMNASNVLGQTLFTTATAAKTQSGIDGPYDIAIDETNQKLFLAEEDNNRVMVFDLSSGITDGMNASNVLGQAIFTSSTVATTQAGMSKPRGVVFDSDNNYLYVDDFTNNRILVFDLSGGITDGMDASYVLGQEDFVTATAGTDVDSLSGPIGLEIDTENSRLYVGENTNDRVLVFDISTIVNGEDAVAVLGQPDFTTTGETVTQVSTRNPNGLAFDSNNNRLYVVNATANRVNIFDFVEISGSLPDTTQNNTYNQTISTSNSQGTVTFILESGSLPNGLSLSSSISGTVEDSPGMYTFTISANDDNSGNGIFVSSPTQMTLQVNGASSGGGSGSYIFTPILPIEEVEEIIEEEPILPVLEEEVVVEEEEVVVEEEEITEEENSIEIVPTNFKPDSPSPVLIEQILPATSLFQILKNPEIQKSIDVVTISSLAVSSVASLLAFNPITFSEFALLPLRLWSLILTFLGIKKRSKPWGTVYDSVTKQPLDPAYVVLKDSEGKEVASAITDMDGRFGFLALPGKYFMEVKKTHYSFPSKQLLSKQSDELYNNLYHKEEIILTEDNQTIIKNIPMDPIDFDWNEFAKKDQKLMTFYSRWDKVLVRVATIMYPIGLVSSILGALTSQSTLNIVVLCLYLIISIMHLLGLKPKPHGTIFNQKTPLSFAVIKIYTADLGYNIKHCVTNKYGKYYCLVQKGKYYFTIDKKMKDGSYEKVFTSDVLNLKHGYLNADIDTSLSLG